MTRPTIQSPRTTLQQLIVDPQIPEVIIEELITLLTRIRDGQIARWAHLDLNDWPAASPAHATLPFPNRKKRA